MAELQEIVDLWKQARERGEAVYLATVAHVEGSSYRKPPARMLITADGRRAGTVSGGCLEAEIVRKIAWLTQKGATVECYQSSFDDDQQGVPYGLGCGGSIWILMQAQEQAAVILNALERAVEERSSCFLVTALKGTIIGHTALTDAFPPKLEHQGVAELPEFLYMAITPPPHLTIFGAGDDARPLSRFAVELGWQVTIADGRGHLLTRERFPEANELQTLEFVQAAEGTHYQLQSILKLQPDGLAVIMTHSYEQDGALLKALLPQQVRYLGILGPLHRTKRLVEWAASGLNLSVDRCFAKLHAPVGFRIGSAGPAAIALSIVAEIQAELAGIVIDPTLRAADGK